MGSERAARAIALGAVIRACADADVGRAEELATRSGAATVESDAAKLPWRELDAVFICTPPSVRGSAVRHAIEAGVATFVEKPIGLSAAEGEALADAAHRARIVNAVGYMNRYRASVRSARTIAANHKVIAVTCQWVCRPYGVPWWRSAEQSGGPFNEQATHIVDLCRFVAGEVADVRSVSSGDDPERPTRFAAALRFENNAVGTLAYTCDAPDKFIAFELITTSGALRLEGWDFKLAASTFDLHVDAEDDVFETETRAFLTAAMQSDQSLIASSFDDAVRTQSVVDRVRNATVTT
jgi:predicted dehydrogenase